MHQKSLLTAPFALVWFASLFEGLAFTLYLHFPGYLQQLGADEVQIGLIIGVSAVSSVAVRPWVGKTVDTRGRRPVIILGNSINVAALMLYLTITALGPWVYLVRILHGVGFGILFTALFTYAADVVPESRRTQGLALFGVSGLLSIGLGGLIGDIVLGWTDFTGLFITALTLGIVALALSLALAETLPPGVVGDDRRGFVAAIRQADLRPLWFIGGVFAVVLTAYFTFLKTFVGNTSIGSVGLFFSFYAGTAVALRLLFGWLPDRVGQRRVLYPALVILGLGFVVLARAESAFDIAAAGVLSGTGHGFGFPILIGMVVTRAPDPDRGTAIAVFTSEFDLGLLVGGPLLGAVIARWGYPTMFGLCALATFVAVAVFAIWDRGRVVDPDLVPGIGSS